MRRLLITSHFLPSGVKFCDVSGSSSSGHFLTFPVFCVLLIRPTSGQVNHITHQHSYCMRHLRWDLYSQSLLVFLLEITQATARASASAVFLYLINRVSLFNSRQISRPFFAPPFPLINSPFYLSLAKTSQIFIFLSFSY